MKTLKKSPQSHTPGPWTDGDVETIYLTPEAADHLVVGVVKDAKGDTVAYVPDWGGGSDNDALLISAAPDLLAALQMVQRVCDYGRAELDTDEAAQIDAAIRKAEGRKP